MVVYISEEGREAGISFTAVKRMNGWWWICVLGVTLWQKVSGRNVVEPKRTDENWTIHEVWEELTKVGILLHVSLNQKNCSLKTETDEHLYCF
jgi:hypothetical protein